MKSIESFDKLFDLDQLQKIQDSFAKAAGVASIITDPDGRPITRPSNFCNLCKNVIRKTEKGLCNCIHSDAVIGQYHPDGPIIQTCLSGGLWDAGASINVAGNHIASWLIGQVRNEKTNIKKVLEYAKTIGADQNKFATALNEVTVMSFDQFKDISHCLYLIANQLSEQAYQRFKQGEIASTLKKSEDKLKAKTLDLQQTMDSLIDEIENKNRIGKELIKKNEYMESLHETALGMFSRLALSQVLESILVRASNLTQIPDGFVHLFDSKENVLEITAACGKYLPLKGIKFAVGEGISGKVWETGESLVCDDYQKWFGKTRNPQFDFITSAMGVPLTSGSKIEGAMVLSHNQKESAIPVDGVSVLEQFAELATLAIDNAKLFDSMKDELDQRIRLENEQKQMESRLRRSQKMEAIGTLAGGIAHDFNNILFPILGFSEMILHDLPDKSPVKHQIQAIRDASLRAKDLVQQILTFSRETEQNYQPLKIQLIIKEVLKLVRASLPSTIKIINTIPKEIGMIMADPSQVHQILMNLITNASHSMEENGGELSVVLKEIVQQDEVSPVLGMMPGHYICLTVEDTGSGMDQTTLKRIFEPYFTTKPRGKGTGLGLAVVHGIVKNLHGEIIAQSTVGKGSSFSVYLPKIIKNSEDSDMKTLSIAQLNGDERILLIDDEKPVLNIVGQILSRFGYKVTAHNMSIDALDCFKQSPHDFDLVITDMTMPGLTGDKIVTEMKKVRPEIPVILCTGFSEKMVDGMVSAARPDKILMKPAGKDNLLKTIRVLLDT
jgi:signal transduction histidine kinase/ligand-binding sensor protein